MAATLVTVALSWSCASLARVGVGPEASGPDSGGPVEPESDTPRYAVPRVRFEVRCDTCTATVTVGSEIRDDATVLGHWSETYDPRVPDPGYAELVVLPRGPRGVTEARIVVNQEVVASYRGQDELGRTQPVRLRAEIPYGG